ncbi:Deoxycytidylate deaminase [Nymphaea thermarum]|nr:Deoxycytidylate deaminase [Nymphaea thermarum]
MVTKEVLLVSASALVGAAASAVAFQLFSRWIRPCSGPEPSANGIGECSIVDPYDPSKRKGYLSWDDYFMAIAFLSAKRSKDPNRQVGACLVSQNGVILGRLCLLKFVPERDFAYFSSFRK